MTQPAAVRHDIDDDGAVDRALFRPVGPLDDPSRAIVEATAYTRGPWDHGLQHGGPVAGLAAWASERVTLPVPGLQVGRLTVDLLRGVPVGRLAVSTEVVRAGRRSAVIDVEITEAAGGQLVARSSSQWVAPSVGWESPKPAPPPKPAEAVDPDDGDFEYPRPGFNCDAAELRYVSGSNETPGPGVIWARLTSPIVAGEPMSPFTTVATVTDLAAAAGFERGPNYEAFINPDVTLQIHRLPIGQWLALDAANRRSESAVGYNEATVYDESGQIGKILQTLVEVPDPPASANGGHNQGATR